MGGRRILGRLGLALAGTLLTLLLCEVGVRVHQARTEERNLAAWRGLVADERPPLEGPAKLLHLIRPSVERRVVYELVPKLEVEFVGVPVRINAQGFRGPPVAPTRRPGTRRVLGIGDSVMFGWGVDEASCFLRVLERRWNADHPERPVEVINAAVPGYNTVMQVETLLTKGLALEPDLVVLDYVGNDLSLPNFLVRRTDYLTLARSFLLELLQRRTTEFRPFEPAPREDRFQFASDPEQVPPEYSDLVGQAAFRAAMGRLAELGREHGFDVVVTTHLAAPQHLVAVCAELGLPLVEVHPRLRSVMTERGIDRYRGSVLTLSDTDLHPSAVGHGIHAELLAQRIEAEGWLAGGR
jgi:lysophospholipase L1-like esterase